MDKVKMAFVGISYPHAAGYRETLRLMPDEVEIVAFYDPDPEGMREKLHADHRQIPIYDNIETLVKQHHPEAAMVYLPNNVRPQVLTQLANKGVHLIAEKPVATSAAALKETAEAVAQHKIVFYPGYQWRKHPLVTTLKDYVDKGIFGQLTSLELRYVASNVTIRNPKHMHFNKEMAGGGFLNWLGVHWFDLARFVTSREVTSVMSFVATLSGEAIEVEDVAVVALRFDNGMLGSLNCGYVFPKSTSEAYFGLRGTLGWVNWDLFTWECTVNSVHPDWYPATTRLLSYKEEILGGYAGGVAINLVRDFIRAFRENGPQISTIHDAIADLAIVDAAYESSRTGRQVDL